MSQVSSISLHLYSLAYLCCQGNQHSMILGSFCTAWNQPTYSVFFSLDKLDLHTGSCGLLHAACMGTCTKSYIQPEWNHEPFLFVYSKSMALYAANMNCHFSTKLCRTRSTILCGPIMCLSCGSPQSQHNIISL